MQYGNVGDTLYFYFAANDTTGSASDGASAYAEIRLAGGAASDAPIIAVSPTLLTHASFPDGAYEVAVDTQAVNGFVAFSTYAVFCSLAVDGQNPIGYLDSFKLGPILTGVSSGTPSITASGGLSVSAQTIIKNALREIGRMEPDGTIQSEDARFGYDKLNRLVSVLRLKRGMAYTITSASYAFTTSRSAYTVGPTGHFVTVRPNKIVRANLIRTASTIPEHIPLPIRDYEQDYSQQTLPLTSGSEPAVLYIRMDYPNVTLFPWPYPEADNTVALANEIELFTWSPLSSFADMTTLYDLPDGLEDVLTLTLAERLCSGSGKTASPELVRSAAEARAAYQSLNTKIPRLSTDGSVLTDEERLSLRPSSTWRWQ